MFCKSTDTGMDGTNVLHVRSTLFLFNRKAHQTFIKNKDNQRIGVWDGVIRGN